MKTSLAYSAKLPMYVFHCEAGAVGRSRFTDMPAVDRFATLLRLLPGNLANWERNDGKEPTAPLTVFAGGQPNRYWPEIESAPDGCVRNTGSRQGDCFWCFPIGIRPAGLTVQARHDLQLTAYNPLTGAVLTSATLRAAEPLTLPAGPGALIIRGQVLHGER